MRCLLFKCVLCVSLIILYLFLIFIVHPVPVIIEPFMCCKLVLEFVPASYAINRLYKCLCGHAVLPACWWMFPELRRSTERVFLTERCL